MSGQNVTIKVGSDVKEATAGINKMIEAYTVNIFTLNKVENIIQLLNIMMINGKAKAYTLSYSHAVLNARHGLLVGTINTTELVVYIL